MEWKQNVNFLWLISGVFFVLVRKISEGLSKPGAGINSFHKSMINN